MFTPDDNRNRCGVAVVDEAGGGHVQGAKEIVTRALAVELDGAEVDVRGDVTVQVKLETPILEFNEPIRTITIVLSLCGLK